MQTQDKMTACVAQDKEMTCVVQDQMATCAVQKMSEKDKFYNFMKLYKF